MVDPDGIQIQKTNLPSDISIKEVPEYEYEIYNFADEKEFNKFIKDVEASVRRSFEYRKFIKYCREYLGMNKCAFLKDVSNADTFDIKIEIHHYPFSLSDICRIVYKKRAYYNESLSVYMVSKEVMMLHYKMMVGLIPLSETVHELFHNGRLFIPVDRVAGRYNLFVDYYKPFIDDDMLETLERIEKYTLEDNKDLLNTTILDQNKVTYQIKDENFQLPDFSQVTNAMQYQLEMIKNNHFLLPDVNTVNDIEKHKKETECPISFNESLIKEEYKK